MRKTKVGKVCEFCGGSFSTIVLKKRFCSTSCSAKWRMSDVGFKKRFYTIERNHNISLSRKGIVFSERHKEALRAAHTGKKLSEEHKANIGSSVKGEKNGNFGRCFSLEHRNRISAALKNKIRTEDFKSHLREINAGSGHPQYGKHRSTETKDKLRVAALNQTHIYKDTSIERLMESELIKRGVEFKKQAVIKNIARVDFLVGENIIIECDGDYWHKYPEGTVEDKVRDAKLLKAGFIVYRFWERDIKKDILKCVNLIQELANAA